MMLHEANNLLKKHQITEEQLEELNPCYILLDLDKDDFCRIIDLIGIEKISQKQNYYKKHLKAMFELRAKERYIKAKEELEELEERKEELEEIITNYQKENKS